MEDTSIPEGSEASVDQLIELSHELCRAWMQRQVERMAERRFDSAAYEAGWLDACKSMQERLDGASFGAFHGEG